MFRKILQKVNQTKKFVTTRFNQNENIIITRFNQNDFLLKNENPYDIKKMLLELQDKLKSEEFKNKFRNQDPRIYLGILLAISLASYYVYEQNNKDYVTFIEFKKFLENDQVKQITLFNKKDGNTFHTEAQIEMYDGKLKNLVLGNVDHFLEQLEEIQMKKNRNQDQLVHVILKDNYQQERIEKILNDVMHLVTSVLTFYVIYRGMKQFGSQGQQQAGKLKIKIFGVDQKIKTRFKDVAGLDEAKIEIMEFVDFLKKPQKYSSMGARIPRGALLTGPPGTGKTLLAKACAGEAQVPFLTLSGSDFVEMFVGVGASRVRDLFKQAKELSPSIIFIDEIDAIGRKRDTQGGNDERDNTLNQLLVEMDGFSTDHHVVILAATNRKELLDSALVRPGRFDRDIDVTIPDINGRIAIFKVHLNPLKLDVSTTTLEEHAKRLAQLTPGFSGADIANLCNEAAILAARKNKEFVETIDFEMASERVVAGLEKKGLVSEAERKTVAVHEAGHAVLSWFIEGCMPLVKLTIIPRAKGSLGFAQYLPSEGSLETKQELMDRLIFILGGRCAELEFFGKITNGASDDLQKATKIAYTIVSKLGMNDLTGNVSYKDNENRFVKQHSEETQKEIDLEIQRIINEATVKAKQYVKQYKQQIQLLSDELLQKETLDLKQIINVIGERPFKNKSSFDDYLESKKEISQEINEKNKTD